MRNETSQMTDGDQLAVTQTFEFGRLIKLNHSEGVHAIAHASGDISFTQGGRKMIREEEEEEEREKKSGTLTAWKKGEREREKGTKVCERMKGNLAGYV